MKISIIGAGSAVFSLSLIKDICLTPNLADSLVSLMDVNLPRLESAHALCCRYAEEVGLRLRIEKTSDRRECLRGADFVINAALAAGPGWRRLQEGWKVAFRHGYRFGGSLHVVHDEAFWINYYQLALMEALLRDLLELCPQAWYVQVANPVLAGVTYLSRKYAGARIVGMCHGYAGIYDLADVLGLERNRIDFEIPGVNHFVWLTHFEHEGRDALPLLERWVADRSEEHFRRCSCSEGLGPKVIDLYRRFGALPVGDTATPGGGSWGYWYHRDRRTERRWKEDPRRWFDRYFADGLETVRSVRQVAADGSRRVAEAFPGHSGEPVVPLIEALACNVERKVVVNIPNSGGFVEGVPVDFEVEVPATVNASGIFGHKTRKLPDPVLSFLVRDRVIPVELELKAFETGRLGYLMDLILMDPWTRSGDQARRLLQAIMALPYHEQMRRHFRA